MIDFNVPPRTIRGQKSFKLAQHSPLNNMMKNANKFQGDIFHISLDFLNK
ncbi:unnamed protein product [Acanthoscelides obtectus]|uniref:Uncharacterized protein n=1 Tax=Acanthoscelides obtectus TaxID=200917 RepID=A0A9P0K4R3_ACAOB|nr:unnamed protein product [Acanthoscelides obtectus]CAK1622684.1 hypothetical protein AOBTE_LOCUS1622 [Acanthoscelides obtectus]